MIVLSKPPRRAPCRIESVAVRFLDQRMSAGFSDKYERLAAINADLSERFGDVWFGVPKRLRGRQSCASAERY